MKTKNIAALLNENCKTIGVNFPNSGQASENTVYTYKTTQDLELEDKVVVMVRNKLKIAKVVEVHKVPQIDLASDLKYQWIVQKVDMSEYNQLNSTEEEFTDSLLEIEQANVRRQSMMLLQEHLGLEDTALQDLTKKLNSGA